MGASVFPSVRDECNCADQCPQTACPTATELHLASVGTTLLTTLMSSKFNQMEVQLFFPSVRNSSEHTISVLLGNAVFGKEDSRDG